MLLLCKGVAARPRRLPLLLAAGALAVVALLVKQSFGDALLAGLSGLAAATAFDKARWRTLLAGAGAYLAGLLAAVLAMELWELATGLRDGSMSYSLLGFRLEGLSTLAGSAGSPPGRFAERLMPPLVLSGLIVVLAWSPAGIRRLRRRRVLGVTVGAWGLGGAIGVLSGGSYWAHYLIQLVPFAVVTASLGRAIRAADPAAIGGAAPFSASSEGVARLRAK